MSVECFGVMQDGRSVERITLHGGSLTAHILSYGAILQDLRLDGHGPSLVLGYPTFTPYLTDTAYLGASVGRCANRVRDGHLELDGVTYQLDKNSLGKHMLHGGGEGTSHLLWTIDWVKEDAAQLSIELPDGHMGFPGSLKVSQVVSLRGDGVLDIQISAKSDALTICNFAHHSYFNLGGADSVLDHDLWVDAIYYIPTDEEGIPTGEIKPLSGSVLDFQHEKRLSAVLAEQSIDNNYCLASGRRVLSKAARLCCALSGVAMELWTTEPGLQIYDAGGMALETLGHEGRVMQAHAGLAMEPQVWPDANHHAAFPQALLNVGETYRQHSQFRFSKATS